MIQTTLATPKQQSWGKSQKLQFLEPLREAGCKRESLPVNSHGTNFPGNGLQLYLKDKKKDF